MAIEQKIIERLKEIVGAQHVQYHLEKLLVYAFDGTFKEHLPDVVVKPHCTEEVVAVVKLAHTHGIPITARGAATSLSGGPVPMAGGIVLEMTAFRDIIEINVRDRYAVVQPGVITNHLADEVEKYGLFYPPDPASGTVSTLGGNVAECAGGGRGVKYGVTKDYVLEMEVVLPNGQMLVVGNKVDGQCGWLDFPMLFTGSEGMLAIITQLTLRLIPKPQTKKTALAKFSQLAHGANTVSAIIGSGIIPTTIEIIDQTTMIAVENFLQAGLDTSQQAYLLLEVDGADFEVQPQLEQIVQICNENQAVEVQVAQNEQESATMWMARKSISGACGKINPTKIGEDVTVPRSEVPAMIQAVRAIAKKHQLKMVVYGHAGDGNLHPNILTNKYNHEEMQRVELAIQDLFQAAIDLGGTLSGEHGIGSMKAPYLKMELGEAGYRIQKMIKDTMDEKNIFNPKKMFVAPNHSQKK